jgi:hypothetical protein
LEFPSTLLPADLLDRATGGGSEIPERRLMAAILFDAVLQLARRGSKGAAEASWWIRHSDSADTPFSFGAVCEGLGLDTDYLRRGLLSWSGTIDDGTVLPSRRSLATQRQRRVALPAGARRRALLAG